MPVKQKQKWQELPNGHFIRADKPITSYHGSFIQQPQKKERTFRIPWSGGRTITVPAGHYSVWVGGTTAPWGHAKTLLSLMKKIDKSNAKLKGVK